MPDTKITALTAIGANPIIPATFPIPMVDLTDTSMAASGTTKKVTVNQILGAGGTATLASATITGDLTVATDRLKVVTGSTAVQIGSTTQTQFGTTAWPSDLIAKANSRVLVGNLGTVLLWNESAAAIGNASNLFIGAKSGAGATTFGGSYISSGIENASDRAGFFALSTFQSNGIDRERYRIDSTGVHTWQYVGGVAGTAMTLNSTGLGVGQPATTSKLEVGIINTSTAGLIEANALKIENSNATVNNAAGLFLSQSGTAGCGIAAIATSRTAGSRTSDLALYYYNQSTSSSPIEGLRLNSSGNVGVGVTPSAWVAGAKALQFGAYGALAQSSSGNIELSFNSYNSGAGAYKYLQTDTASLYRASSVHSWFVAPSGTAGNNITFTQAMTLESTGSLVLGAAAVATTATDGFLYIPGCAGTPTGTPTAKTGRVPLVVDTTNNKLYFYSGGAWVAAN